jgi:hypothetical protein
MPNTRRTNAGFGPSFWQVSGVGDDRHTVYGTVEKVYGGYSPTTQDGAVGPARDRLRDAQEWLYEEYKRWSARIVTLQPADHVDGITDDGTELTKRPYPFHVNARGEIQRRAGESRVVGFVSDPARMEVDLSWDEVYADPQRAVGQYVITQDTEGAWATHTIAIMRVTEV